jgi:hypothetical protein
LGRTGSVLDWPDTDMILVLGIHRALEEFDRKHGR